MAELRAEGDQLVLHLTAAEHLEGAHGDIVVPMSSISTMRESDDLWSELRGIRAPGTESRGSSPWVPDAAGSARTSPPSTGRAPAW